MRTILAVALVALAAACGSDHKQKPLQYGAPQQPNGDEQLAATGAASSLQQLSLAAPAPTTTPDAGAVGLADQLVADLNGAVVAKTSSPWSAKAAQAVALRAFDTTGMDPACVGAVTAGGVTTWTWGASTPCHVVITDAVTGDTITVDIAGTLAWNPATRHTAWNIREPMSMHMVSSGSTMDMAATATFEGWTTVGDATFDAEMHSSVSAHGTFRDGATGQTVAIDEGIQNSLAAKLGFVTAPAFCITSGTLTVEQRWTQRPAGASAAQLPDQGWLFTWTGCGSFTVQHGS